MPQSPVISLILPTRGRTEKARCFIASARQWADQPMNFEVILGVDDDDLPSHEIAVDGVALSVLTGPKRSMGDLNSQCAQHAKGDILMLVNDDSVIRTQGWDTALRELHARFSDRVYLGYVNDLFKGKKLCTFPILSRSTFIALQHAFPSEYKGAFIDYHLLDIFMRLRKKGQDRIVYLQHVIFEHLHYRTGKSQLDATYQARDRFGDDEVFFTLSEMRAQQADALLTLINRTDRGAMGAMMAYPRSGVLWPHRWHQLVPMMWRRFLNDADLPIRWRMFLFRWFLSRWLYARVFV